MSMREGGIHNIIESHCGVAPYRYDTIPTQYTMRSLCAQLPVCPPPLSAPSLRHCAISPLAKAEAAHSNRSVVNLEHSQQS